SFHRRAADALADPHLPRKIERATTRLVSARHASFAAFPEGEALRDEARAIRARVVAHLDQHLIRFEAELQKRGAHLHWAATRDDAVRIVVDIARAKGARTIVKGKSMVSEEIELNAALEAEGLHVVETDLGEYVAQLAGEHPSHIVGPIIHKSRDDVAAVFREKLGAGDEDVRDAASMTALVRRTLRAVFIRADMGISGANFGVAETGSICIVTNEGNGRLTTTIPRVHVALMGIERIVPTMEDLSVMLRLLARSATGQTLSVYSNIITGPRRRDPAGSEAASEPDGPDELHVVLVDNGRTELLGTELAEILYCIRCGACLNTCPVFQNVGGHAYGSVYSGPVGAVLTPALRGLEAYPDLPHASSLCGACREICPVRIDIPRMLLALRARGAARPETPLWIRHGIRIYAWLASRPRLFGAAARMARIASRARATDGWLRSLPGPLAGWTAHRDFPAFAPRSFQQLWRERGRGRKP
ncbi:MAG TPA: LutB/LldF family L-lactate oxidation iron-sulfur protein, partial [Vicinamibacterales bacterium]|nr:LutB/LldF family L-lactate oxidation iron-sulfur protein [Vicinamibacterales bacterium]